MKGEHIVPSVRFGAIALISGWAFLTVLLGLGGVQSLGAQDTQGSSRLVHIEAATGLGSYYPGDAARGRREALEAAFRDAVEQAGGIFITAETEMRNYDLVKDEVLTRSEGFIREHVILEEGRQGELYKVVIQANVEQAAFIKDVSASLALLYQRVGKPRVVVVITEINDPLDEDYGDAPDSALGVTEKEIRKILLKQGFHFVDARSILGGDMLESAVTGGSIRRDRAINLGREAEAELVVLGRVETRSKGKISRFHSVQASLSLDVVRVDNGQVMASETVLSKPAIDLDAKSAGVIAMKNAAIAITPRMMQQVSYLWVKERNQGSRIEILVENISFGDLIAFSRALGNSVKDVKQVDQRSYADGVALLEVLARGNSEKLAISLYETKFDKFDLEIRNVTNNRVTLSVVVR